MSFDADNRLTAFNGWGVFFDPDGNMTTGPAVPTQLPTTYSYDARNRLTAYSYNADGRRTALTDYTTNSNGIATSFAIDPNGQLDRVLIRNVAGLQTFYVYGLGLIGQVRRCDNTVFWQVPYGIGAAQLAILSVESPDTVLATEILTKALARSRLALPSHQPTLRTRFYYHHLQQSL